MFGKTVVFSVSGMKCTHCSGRVEKALSELDGVKNAKADHTTGKVSVKVKDGVDNSALISAIENAGYKVEGTLDK